MAVVTGSVPPLSGPTYRSLIGLITIQFFGNQAAGSFWLVYLVSTPQSLPFELAILVWLIGFGVAAILVLAMSRGRPIGALTSITVGMIAVAVGHFAFLFLSPLSAVLVAGVGFGVYIPAFWLPMNTLLVRATNRGNRAGRLAGLTATFTTVAVVAPVFGGYVADVLGYRMLFAIGGVIVLGNLVLFRRLIDPAHAFAFSIDWRATHPRTVAAFAGQGGVDGLLSVATPLGSFLFTTNSFELGLLFFLFSLAAGVAAVILGRISDRTRRRTPFLLLGPILSVLACLLAYTARDLSGFAVAIGWLSMTSAIAPSFIYTMLVDRMEGSVPNVTATREFSINLGRSVAIMAGLGVLAVTGGVYPLYLLVGAVILLEALAK